MFKNLYQKIEDSIKNNDSIKLNDAFKDFLNIFIFKVQDTFLSSLTKKPLNVDNIQWDKTFSNFDIKNCVSFYLKNTPGWKHGIWFGDPKKNSNKYEINAIWFAQYEENIDKFKPSASAYNEQFTISIYENDDPILAWDTAISQCIYYISKNPYLAFCKDLYFLDYNHIYYSKLKAKYIFYKYKYQKIKSKIYSKYLNNKIVHWFKHYFKKEIKNKTFLLYDSGPWCMPRFKIILKQLDKNIELGSYRLFENCCNGEILMKKFNKLLSHCDKIVKFQSNIDWFLPIDRYPYATVVTEKDFSDYLNSKGRLL